MSVTEHVEETCEACGCVAEIGTLINEGDDQLTLDVTAASLAEAHARVARFVELAKAIAADVKVAQQVQEQGDQAVVTLQLTFGCTAEKLIFEMRSRAI